jgi:hypothetical protein
MAKLIEMTSHPIDDENSWPAFVPGPLPDDVFVVPLEVMTAFLDRRDREDRHIRRFARVRSALRLRRNCRYNVWMPEF